MFDGSKSSAIPGFVSTQYIALATSAIEDESATKGDAMAKYSLSRLQLDGLKA